MTFFPDRPYDAADDFAVAYFDQLQLARETIDRSAIRAAAEALQTAIREDRTIFSCGNGGSAAISNHLLCDYLKGIRGGTTIKPRVHTLSSSVELITAIANDIGAEEIFALPLESLARAGDVLVVISSSGASPNIVRALETAASLGMTTIAMTGFEGGASARLADISLHVASDNYGVVEDTHQSLMHILAQYLRQAALTDPASLGTVRF
jgi:D-sedoheptulose 7-phosphate isomerase